VLLEADKLTSGTTWHSAGLLWQLAGLMGQMDTDIASAQYTKKLVTEILPAETDDWAGWTETGPVPLSNCVGCCSPLSKPRVLATSLSISFSPGKSRSAFEADSLYAEMLYDLPLPLAWLVAGSLLVSSTKDRHIAHNRTRLLASALYGVEAHDVTPSEALSLHPLLNVSDLYGAVYNPGDGNIDPTAIVRAYTAAAKQRGGLVCEGVRVQEIHTDGRVTGLTTDQGEISTPVVINCAGVWSRKIASMAGLDCPLLAYKHAYVVTESVQGLAGSNQSDHPTHRTLMRTVSPPLSGQGSPVLGTITARPT